MNQNVKGYWSKKEKMAHRAYEHYIFMGRTFPKEINNSITNTKLYDGNIIDFLDQSDKPKTSMYGPKIDIVDMDSVSAIYEFRNYTDNMAVLNFASYKNPGGMFLKGSTAQEESLCHNSTLYNVLSHFSEYYAYNKRNLNKALYTNRALYSPNIIFGKDNITTCCDVITCAAPNWTTAKLIGVTEDDNTKALISRIQFVLNVAKYSHVDTLILGAYGCGVFGQNPMEVANIFMYYLKSDFAGDFKHVIFAIPSSNFNNNLDVFLKIICS